MNILTLLQLPSINPDEVVRYVLIKEVSQNKNYLIDRLLLAMEVTDCPVVYISILDDKSQHILTTEGLMKIPINWGQSPCQMQLNSKDATTLSDITKDPLKNHLKVSHKDLKLHSEFPLLNLDSISIGTICIADKELKVLDEKTIKILKMIAEGIVAKFNNNWTLIKTIKENIQNVKTTELVEVLIDRATGKLTCEEEQYLTILGKNLIVQESKTKGLQRERPNAWYQNGQL